MNVCEVIDKSENLTKAMVYVTFSRKKAMFGRIFDYFQAISDDMFCGQIFLKEKHILHQIVNVYLRKSKLDEK